MSINFDLDALKLQKYIKYRENRVRFGTVYYGLPQTTVNRKKPQKTVETVNFYGFSQFSTVSGDSITIENLLFTPFLALEDQILTLFSRFFCKPLLNMPKNIILKIKNRRKPQKCTVSTVFYGLPQTTGNRRKPQSTVYYGLPQTTGNRKKPQKTVETVNRRILRFQNNYGTVRYGKTVPYRIRLRYFTVLVTSLNRLLWLRFETWLRIRVAI